MKSRMNAMVLIAEIAVIVVLHAVKINQEKKNDFRPSSHLSSSASIRDEIKMKSLSILTKY
jgi:hypothetical protein